MKKTAMTAMIILNILALSCLIVALYVSYIVKNFETEAMLLWGYIGTHSLSELIKYSVEDEW